MDTSLPAWQLAGCSSAPQTALSHLAGLAYLSGCGLYVWPLCNGEHGAVSAENTHSTAADGWTASNAASQRGYHEPMGNQKEDHYASRSSGEHRSALALSQVRPHFTRGNDLLGRHYHPIFQTRKLRLVARALLSNFPSHSKQ